MLPAQDEKRQLDSVSTVADDWETLRNSNATQESVALGRHLETVHLDSIERANRELEKISAHVKSLEHLLGAINELHGGQNKIITDKPAAYPGLEDSKLDGESNVSAYYPLPALVHLLGAPPAPASPTPGATVPATDSLISRTEVERRADESTFLDEGTAARDPIALDDKSVSTRASSDEILTPVARGDFLPSLESETSVQSVTEVLIDDGDLSRSIPLTDDLPSGALASTSSAANETQDSTKTPSTEAGEFDTKLLDDLIKNYGEFAANPNLPATSQPPAARFSDRKPQPNPNEVKPQSPLDRNTATASHDIDRKLKKLIQDYGEYDLYSQGSNLKAKLRVSGAFVVLVAVLGGIYYFGGPKTSSETAPSVISEGQPAESTGRSNDAISTPLDASDSTNGTETNFEPPHPSKVKKINKGGSTR